MWILGIAATLLLALPASSARAADGQALFEANCAKCHGKTGMADTTTGKAAKAPKLKGDAHLQGADAEALVMKSVRDPAKKKHVQVSTKVSDADLAAIATYVKALAAP
jgi:cytochrome c oxidase cbb3-type subunit 3